MGSWQKTVLGYVCAQLIWLIPTGHPEVLYCHNAPINAIRGGGGGGRVGVGILTFCPKFLLKNHSPGITYFVKKTQKSPPKDRGVMSNVSTQRQVIHSRHPPRPNQTKKLYVTKPTKNRNHSSNQLHEIK